MKEEYVDSVSDTATIEVGSTDLIPVFGGLNTYQLYLPVSPSVLFWAVIVASSRAYWQIFSQPLCYLVNSYTVSVVCII